MKKILSLVISVAILAFMYWKIGPEDRARLLEIFRNADSLWMVLSLAMVVPLTLFTSWRLQQLMPSADQLPLGEANKLILVASVLNLILPSKMGDIAKAYFLRDRGHLNGSLALSLVVFEKSCDMLSLLLWCVFGLFLYPQKDGVFWTMTTAVAVMLVLGCLLLGSKPFARFFFQLADRFAPRKIKARVGQLAGSWEEMHDYFWASKARLFKVTATSVFVWFLHLLQIWMFILALRGHVFFLENPAFARLHFVESLALSPLALLAGLLPVPTFGGAGPRDGALIALYAPYFPAPVALGLGLLCTARYLLPAIGGLPFLSQYIGVVKTMNKAELSPKAEMGLSADVADFRR